MLQRVGKIISNQEVEDLCTREPSPVRDILLRKK